MDHGRICALAILGAVALTVLRKWNADLLPLARVAVAVMLALGGLVLLAPTVNYLKDLAEKTEISGYTAPLFKALAVALLTHLCAELCRESGEGGVADGVELAGQLEILLLCLPLINEILEVAGRLLSIVS
jgi:stage III sporulation protein AD